MMQNRRDFEPHQNGLERVTVSQIDRNPFAQCSAVKTTCWSKFCRSKPHSLHLTTVHFGDQCRRINTWRANQLECSRCSTSHRHACGLQDLNAWVQKVLAQSLQCWRLRDPREPRHVIEVSPAPILHHNHVQICADLIFGIEHQRQLTHGHRVPYGHWKVTDERSSIPVEHGSFDCLAAERIRPVEHKKGEML